MLPPHSHIACFTAASHIQLQLDFCVPRLESSSFFNMKFCPCGLVIAISVISGVLLVRGDDHGTPPCPRSLSVPLTEFRDSKNGSLYSKDALQSRGLIWTDDTSTVSVCPCELASVRCIRTCCKPGEVLEGPNCVWPRNFTSNRAVRPEDKNLADELRWIDSLDDAFYVISNFVCDLDAKYLLDPINFPEDEFVIHPNGTLTTQLQTFGQDEYCVASSAIDQKILIPICFGDKIVSPRKPKDVLYPIGMIASIPFLLITVIIYAIIPQLRNIYGKSLMCYLSCLVIAYTFLAVVNLDHNGDMHKVLCTILGIIFVSPLTLSIR